MKRVLRITKCECGTLYPTLNYLGVCEACRVVAYRQIALCHLERRQTRLFKMILLSGGLHQDALFRTLWPNPDDEPEWPENLIRVQTSRINKRTFPFAMICVNRSFFIGTQEDIHHPDWPQRPTKQRGAKRAYDFGGRGMSALMTPELLQAGA